LKLFKRNIKKLKNTEDENPDEDWDRPNNYFNVNEYSTL